MLHHIIGSHGLRPGELINALLNVLLRHTKKKKTGMKHSMMFYHTKFGVIE